MVAETFPLTLKGRPMVTGFCSALDAKMLPNECSTFLIYDFSSNLYF